MWISLRIHQAFQPRDRIVEIGVMHFPEGARRPFMATPLRRSYLFSSEAGTAHPSLGTDPSMTRRSRALTGVTAVQEDHVIHNAARRG